MMNQVDLPSQDAAAQAGHMRSRYVHPPFCCSLVHCGLGCEQACAALFSHFAGYQHALLCFQALLVPGNSLRRLAV